MAKPLYVAQFGYKTMATGAYFTIKQRWFHMPLNKCRQYAPSGPDEKTAALLQALGFL